MALIQWDDSMSVGMEELDEQHRQLIDLINEAYTAVQRHDEHKMDALIAKMGDYARLHFSTEETYLEQSGFPHLEAHQIQHHKFIVDVDEFRRHRFQKTNLSQIFVYLSRWLTTHIMEEDRKFSVYLTNEQLDKSD